MTLFVFAMVCHGELVRLKTPPERLTSFYLAVTAGGASWGACSLVSLLRTSSAVSGNFHRPVALQFSLV